MANNNNNLPSQDDFVREHLHACEAPTEEGSRCSICLVEWAEDSDSLVRIDYNHVKSCFYHRDCIIAWFGSIGQQRWSCPEHRIQLFVPRLVGAGQFDAEDLEDGEILEDGEPQDEEVDAMELDGERPEYVPGEIGGQFFAEDLSTELYTYAQAVLRRLEERVRAGNGPEQERFMFNHGIQRLHDLHLAAAMSPQVRRGPSISPEFHALGQRIRDLTEAYDAQFLEYMPPRMANVLQQIVTETGNEELVELLLPEWWHEVFGRLRDQMNLEPRPANVPILLSQMFLKISRAYYMIRMHQHRLGHQNGPNPLPGPIPAQDGGEPLLVAVNPQAVVTPDGTAFGLDQIYQSVQDRVREHRLINARILQGVPVSETNLFVGYHAARARDLELALFLSGYQYLNDEFQAWSRGLRACVRMADDRFRNWVPGLIEGLLRAIRNEVDSGRRIIEGDLEARLLALRNSGRPWCKTTIGPLGI